MAITFLMLSKEFMLDVVSSEDEHLRAKSLARRLRRQFQELDESGKKYYRVLMTLLQSYEMAQRDETLKSINTGADFATFLMAQHQLSQVEMASIAQVSKQHFNDFIKGRRPLPLRARQLLGRQFAVSPSVFEVELIQYTQGSALSPLTTQSEFIGVKEELSDSLKSVSEAIEPKSGTLTTKKKSRKH